jgi:hypothetical protein
MGLALKSLVDLALIELRLSQICRFVVPEAQKNSTAKSAYFWEHFIHPNQVAQAWLAELEEEVRNELEASS